MRLAVRLLPWLIGLHAGNFTLHGTEQPALQRFRTAVDFHNRGELAQAAESYRAALRLDGGLVSAAVNLAIIHEKWGENAQAEKLYDSAARIAPRSFSARYNRGQFLQKLGRLAEARADYLAALDISPNEASLYVNLAAIEIRLFEMTRDAVLLKEAEKKLNRAEQLKSKSPALYFNRARLLELMNAPARAQTQYREAMRYYAHGSREYQTCIVRTERLSRQLKN